MVIAWPTPESGPSAFPVGCRRPLGYGLASEPAGVKLPFVDVMIEVVYEYPMVFWKLKNVGAQKIPYPPRTTVLLSNW